MLNSNFFYGVYENKEFALSQVIQFTLMPPRASLKKRASGALTSFKKAVSNVSNVSTSRLPQWVHVTIGVVVGSIIFCLILALILYLLPWVKIMRLIGKAAKEGLVPEINTAARNIIDEQTRKLEAAYKQALKDAKKSALTTFQETADGLSNKSRSAVSGTIDNIQYDVRNNATVSGIFDTYDKGKNTYDDGQKTYSDIREAYQSFNE